MKIRRGGLDEPEVIALLAHHVANARAVSPPCSAHALERDALKTPDIAFWSAWEDGRLLGVGALRRLDDGHGEIKSMHTAAPARGRGVAAAILARIIDHARGKGLTRLSLETGSWDYFQPARALYARHGFTPCPPFGDYVEDPSSAFFTLDLSEPRAGKIPLR
jgi:putative acetyltransferase